MKIAVIEDFKLMCDMLVESCRRISGVIQVYRAGTAAEAIAVCREHQPDLVFLDLVLPDGDGFDLLSEILSVSPQSKVIALTSHADEFTLHRAIRAKIHGFVDKNEAPLEVLHEAVAAVLSGKPYYSSAAQRLRLAMRADSTAFDKLLSEHEQRLLSLFGEGLTDDEISDRVAIASKTVKWHRRNVMAKLCLHSTPQLIHYALEKGFTRLRRSAVPAGTFRGGA